MSVAVVMTAAGVTLAADTAEPNPTDPPLSVLATDFVNRVSISLMNPHSMTSISTGELFGNDVDDFMNVNEYGNVMPKNVFGYLSYGDNGTGNINFGFAHQFKKLYLGGWFGGQVNGWSITNQKKVSSPKKDQTGIKHDTFNTAHGKVLFGIGNMGILANFSFAPGSDNGYTDDRENKTKTTTNRFTLDSSVKFGINHQGAKGRYYKTWAEAGLISKVAKKEIKTDGELTSMVDRSLYTIALKGGSSFDVYNANDITQTIDIEAVSNFMFSPTVFYKDKNRTVEQSGLFNMNIGLTPAWTLAYEPEESKIAIKTKAKLAANVHYSQGYDKLTSDGNTLYARRRKYDTALSFTPELAVGIVYKVSPSKFSINAGGKFSVPSAYYTHNVEEDRNTSDGKVDAKNVTDTVSFNSANGGIQLKTGFAWTPSEKVTVDVSWNIFGSKFSGTNVNTIFSKSLAFLVSVKL